MTLSLKLFPRSALTIEFAGLEARGEQSRSTGMREFCTHNQTAGNWSDDTPVTLATMVALLVGSSGSPNAIMSEFSEWLTPAKRIPHGEVFDISRATRDV